MESTQYILLYYIKLRPMLARIHLEFTSFTLIYPYLNQPVYPLIHRVNLLRPSLSQVNHVFPHLCSFYLDHPHLP